MGRMSPSNLQARLLLLCLTGTLSVVLSVPLHAVELGPQLRASLEQEGFTYAIGGSRSSEPPLRSSLAPDGLPQALAFGLLRAEPGIVVETLFRIPPHLLPDDFPAPGTADRELLIYQILHRFRSMEGTLYYSASRDRMREFYLESYRIPGPDNAEPLPDPVPLSVADRASLFIEQEDSSFGRNRYTVDYARSGAWLSISISNLTTVTYGFLPVLRPGRFRSALAIADDNDGGLLVFGIASVDPLTTVVVGDRITRSIFNRSVALFRWFSGQLGTRELPPGANAALTEN